MSSSAQVPGYLDESISVAYHDGKITIEQEHVIMGDRVEAVYLEPHQTLALAQVLLTLYVDWVAQGGDTSTEGTNDE
jgi:hypothetical protein